MKKELKEKWLELYEVADQIKELEPWVNLADNNILGYIDEETGQIIYFCIMGNAGIHKGIGVYRGKEGIGLFEVLEENIPFPIMVNYQSCLKLNYLSEEETLEKNLELLNDLGIKYKDEFTSFEIYEKGYEPYQFYNEEQITEMTKYLKILFEALKAINKMSNIDYDTFHGLIERDQKGDIVINEDLPAVFAADTEPIKLKPAWLTKLRQLPIKNSLELEFDFTNHLPIAFDESKDENGRPCYPYLRVIAERRQGLIYDIQIDDQLKKTKEEFYMESLERFIKILTKSGIPSKLYVRDLETKLLLQNLEENTPIEIKVSHKLMIIDDALERLPFFK